MLRMLATMRIFRMKSLRASSSREKKLGGFAGYFLLVP
jgi:hypothetical protein